MKKEEALVLFRKAFPNSNPWQCQDLFKEDVEKWVISLSDDSVELVSLYCDGWLVLHNSYEKQETTVIAQYRK